MFIHEEINVNTYYFTGTFMLYLETFCLRKCNGGNQNFENWRRFSLVFVKNSKWYTWYGFLEKINTNGK